VTIRVGIADDQPMIRDGFRLQVQFAADLEFVGAAADGEQAVALARSQRPDVLLMDVRMPFMDGIEATRRIVADPALSEVRVLVLTTFDLDEYVYGALRAGASGFLLKDAVPADIIMAIEVVAAGDALLAPAVTRRLITEFAKRPRLARPARLAELTDREHEVFGLVARGLANSEIAAALHLAEQTVKSHVSSVLAKLGLRDRVQAVVLAYESGLITPGAPNSGPDGLPLR
jgi:DNA-binding NarL/FixJ family response regulator